MMLRLWACPENFNMAQGCQGYQYLDPEVDTPLCVSNKGGMLKPESSRKCDRLMVDMGLYEMDFGGIPGGTSPQADTPSDQASSHPVRDLAAVRG